MEFRRQRPLGINKGLHVPKAYKMDLLVEDLIVVENKVAEALNDDHGAQLMTYLRLSGKRVGLMFNFKAAVLTKGMKRIIL